mgnify:CR=1 FL=1
MNAGGLISGGAPVVKYYKVGATVADRGVPLLDTDTGAAGLKASTTTSLADCVGLALDLATYTTTQSATMVEGVVAIIINSDLIVRAKLSGAAAEGTALVVTTNATASAGGTVVTITTGEPAPNSPTMLDGTTYGLSGNNVGLTRAITTVSATAATSVVPFPRAVAVSDTYLLLGWNPSSGVAITATLSTLFTEVRNDTGGTGGGLIQPVDLEIQSDAPRTKSFLHFTFRDHVFGINTQ